MRRSGISALTIAAALAVGPPGAARAASSQIQATLRLTSSIPGTPTGVVLNLVRPDGPGGKPKTEAEGVFQLPDGTVVNQRAVSSVPERRRHLAGRGLRRLPELVGRRRLRLALYRRRSARGPARDRRAVVLRARRDRRPLLAARPPYPVVKLGHVK